MERGEISYSIEINKPHALSLFSEKFGYLFHLFYRDDFEEIIILCIGTDRSTGDCLGPLVGHKLNLIKYRNVFVHGTLDQPVHAKNLQETVQYIEETYRNPFIIAVDACLGKPERIGTIAIGEGPLKPGAGVNKNLPSVGDIHVIGIVNLGGFMEYLILQNTRLNLVMKMADIITNGIHYNLWKFFSQREKEEKIKKN